MQEIVIEKEYQFIEAFHSNLCPKIIKPLVAKTVTSMGIESIEWHGLDLFNQSIKAGHSIMLLSNHCRPSDPLIVGLMGQIINQSVFIMASWHLFMGSPIQKWGLRMGGAFSVFREGLDRKSLNFAIDTLVQAERPLLLCPEGVVTRNNDIIHHLMDGTSMIARTAAKKRAARDGGKTVIHPVFVRYYYQGDIEKLVDTVCQKIEKRLSWQPLNHLPMLERIKKVGLGLLSLKEIEYLGETSSLPLAERLPRLINAILYPLEQKWFKTHYNEEVISRVKRIRTAILPHLLNPQTSSKEKDQLHREMADVYLAQQLFFYPADYLNYPTKERILETIERFEEDLTDISPTYGKIHFRGEIGEAIEVPSQKERFENGEDPLILQVRDSLQHFLVKTQNKPL